MKLSCLEPQNVRHQCRNIDIYKYIIYSWFNPSTPSLSIRNGNPGSEINNWIGGVRRKLLGNTRIEEEDLHPLRHDSPILGSTTTPNYRPVPSSKNTVSKVKRRSQSSHYQRHENTHRFSEVIDTRSIQSDSNPDERKKCSSSTGGGLGRRSATQMELSRRKKKK
ncbi:unnamed protein product [Lepeophtheirus salmonis]|uniref:(salmon louse) hypothetical protein n=1 Tax=Lepeophtheirus salmonis TaxID=72036 RepID=A0A7R8CLH9_LEPSM|nr:unnamed protein product [Lepeophtheirus salmonis]CAF2857744.1 unnamed protein product [Lepeophtheirus salmonis]